MGQFYFEMQPGVDYKQDYADMADWLNKTMDSHYDEGLKFLYANGKEDLFFFMYFLLNIVHINHPWLIPKIDEVEKDHNDTLDLWSRDSWKSTIMSFALPIQEMVKDAERRQVIFSNTRVMAKKFLRRIKFALEANSLLQEVYSDVLFDNPEKQSRKWSEDEGLLVKRKCDYSEMSLEAWGVTESMPIGTHFTDRDYDDLVTWDTTRTADQINKTREGFQLSHNLGVTGGSKRIIGTPYDFNDLYAEIKKSGNYKVREYAADKDPKFWPDEVLEEKKRDMGPYAYSSQISLNPISESEQKFNITWLRWFTQYPDKLNKYILVDPASAKKTGRSWTVMWAFGVDWMQNAYILDIVRDKLNPIQKWEKLKGLVLKHQDGLQKVGYEQYSMQSDISGIQLQMNREKVFFEIQELGGNLSKEDRIRTLAIPLSNGRIWFPREYWYTDVNGQQRDLIKEFLEDEYIHFPAISVNDMLDGLARMNDPKLEISYPMKTEPVKVIKLHGDFSENKRSRRGWLRR